MQTGKHRQSLKRRNRNSIKTYNYFAGMKRSAIVFLFLLFLCFSCNVQKEKSIDPVTLAVNFQLINNAKPLIKSGDIIFRNGTDEVSQAARSMNRKDTSYSHCGVLFIENDSVVVYHALGGSYNPGQKLLREPIDSFCNPKDNNAFGIYRYSLSGDQLLLMQQTVLNYYKQGLKFDMYFNYFSDDKMYCSEFVFKSLNKSYGGALSGYIRLDTIPFGVTTDDIFLHPQCKMIRKESFKL